MNPRIFPSAGATWFSMFLQSTVLGRACYGIFTKNSTSMHVPTHYVIGNNDIFGLRSGVASSDPGYGKKAFEDR
jgi:hypothetical protein